MKAILARLILLSIALAAVPAQAQITFRAASTATVAGVAAPAFRAASSGATTTGTLTIPAPAGTAAADVLIASIAVTPSSVAITPPLGWGLVRRLDNAGPTSNSLAIYRRVAVSGEPASYAWSVSGAGFAVGGIQSFSGVNTEGPVQVEDGQSTASGLTHAAPSITTTAGNAMLVTSHAFGSARTWTPPSGMTESFDRPSGANNATGLSIVGSRMLQVAAGASGAKTATAAGNADAGNAHVLALRPAKVLLTVSTPAGTVGGDVLIAAIAFNNSTASIVTGPTSWTLVRRIDNPGATSNSLAIYRKTADTFDGAHTWQFGGATSLVAGVQAFSGVDAFNPVVAESGQTTASATAHSTPSITTTTPNTMLVTAHTYASSQSWTPQAGLTEAFDRPSGAASATGQSITGGFQPQAAAGASGTKLATAAGTADVGNTHILALRPFNNAPPTLSLTSPANGATFTVGANVTLAATATDTDGTIKNVRLLVNNGSTFGTVLTAPPYSAVWNPSAPGTYTVTATATDDRNATAISSVNVTVVNNASPTVSLTSPTSGASFSAPANIAVSATAADSDGTVQKVEFFHGGTNLITTLTAPPYSFTWTGVAQGTYTLTAVATDNQNATKTSAPVSVTVDRAMALHFVHADHLNTPRLIADSTGTTVWRHDNTEPFASNPPDENPSGLGAFDFPLRFPGQYADRESGLLYSYFRDCFDPATGRYCQPDPIGAGLYRDMAFRSLGSIAPMHPKLASLLYSAQPRYNHVYGYAMQNPLSYIDPLGLDPLSKENRERGERADRERPGDPGGSSSTSTSGSTGMSPAQMAQCKACREDAMKSCLIGGGVCAAGICGAATVTVVGGVVCAVVASSAVGGSCWYMTDLYCSSVCTVK